MIRRILRALLGRPAEELHPEDVPSAFDVAAAQALHDAPDPADVVLDMSAAEVLAIAEAIWALTTGSAPTPEQARHLTDTEESS
jgi:hypothetical protein